MGLSLVDRKYIERHSPKSAAHEVFLEDYAGHYDLLGFAQLKGELESGEGQPAAKAVLRNSDGVLLISSLPSFNVLKEMKDADDFWAPRQPKNVPASRRVRMGFYDHYKHSAKEGFYYFVLGPAYDVNTGKWVVVYQPCYDIPTLETQWLVRDIEGFKKNNKAPGGKAYTFIGSLRPVRS